MKNKRHKIGFQGYFRNTQNELRLILAVHLCMLIYSPQTKRQYSSDMAMPLVNQTTVMIHYAILYMN